MLRSSWSVFDFLLPELAQLGRGWRCLVLVSHLQVLLGLGSVPMQSHRVPWPQGLTLGLMLCGHRLEILNNFWTKLCFSFCTGTCKFCSWPCAWELRFI